jgi:endo-1,4-beta-xylanase
MIRRPLIATLAFPFLISSAWSQAATRIRDAADAVGLNFGLATSANQVRDTTSAYAVDAKTQYNFAVCENDMKFDNTEGPIGTFKYTGGDGLSAFCVANKMKMRGHNFIWHSQSNTASGAVHDRTSGLTVMRNHITAVGGHFKDKILEWDVLNETQSSGTSSFWYKGIGADYTDSALAIARSVIGTSGYLYSNDYGADGVNSKSTAILTQAKKWQANKVPLDGIGFQCHLGHGINKADISANIKRFGDIGLRVSLTEIDITQATAADWTALMGACLENFNCTSFVTWGLSDASSWIGSSCGCLLYNGNPPTPKNDMISAILAALAAADPAVTAKRKAFIALPPGSLGPNAAQILQRPLARRGSEVLFGASPVRIFSTQNGNAIDALGRNRALTPVSSNLPGLSIVPQ